MKWNYVDTDGNPKKEGVYWVTIIFSGWDNEKQKPNNEKFVMVDTRYFGDAKECEGWIMNDEPKEGLVWTEETGSMPNEYLTYKKDGKTLFFFRSYVLQRPSL